MKARSPSIYLLLSLLVACGSAEPRYGQASVSSNAPRASLSGTTFGSAAAMELAPGCPGFLDPNEPAHVLSVEGDDAVTIAVRSQAGPLALAIERDGEVRCDSDSGAGNVPNVQLEEPGEYLVYVAALREPSELAYELDVRLASIAPAQAEAPSDVSVTITSDPAGAEIVNAEGEVIGTTPNMFTVALDSESEGQERSWTLRHDGNEVEVAGVLRPGALTLHGQLGSARAASANEVSEVATGEVAIEDNRSAEMHVDIPRSCAHVSEARVTMEARHSCVSDLHIELRPPNGDPIVLRHHRGGCRPGLTENWNSDRGALRAAIGREGRGRWTLVVRDDEREDVGRLRRFGLELSCSTTPVASVTDRPRPRDRGRPARPNRPPRRVADLPNPVLVRSILGGLRGRAAACAQGGGTVRVLATVRNTGRVSRVSSSGTASPAERRCVERVVRAARFPRFRRNELDIDYSYSLPRRAGQPAGAVIDPFNR